MTKLRSVTSVLEIPAMSAKCKSESRFLNHPETLLYDKGKTFTSFLFLYFHSSVQNLVQNLLLYSHLVKCPQTHRAANLANGLNLLLLQLYAFVLAWL